MFIHVSNGGCSIHGGAGAIFSIGLMQRLPLKFMEDCMATMTGTGESALPCPVLPPPCPVLPCPALPCPALPCPALPCPALPLPALPCPSLPCPALICPTPYLQAGKSCITSQMSVPEQAVAFRFEKDATAQRSTCS